ncbi:hypothetical protein ACSRUE_14940 [Sorangium sp. KYC3313]|uniref:hypothetical protein n=1 Tax=Sorangium sp. KYC3313 TaxID=3449740 RepID=UPI003F8B3D41
MAEYCDVPAEPGVFRVWDEMIHNNYVLGEQYWGSEEGLAALRTILSEHPEIR